MGLDQRSEGIPGIPMPQGWRWMPEGTEVATGGRFVKVFVAFVVITWLSTKKKHSKKFKMPTIIHKFQKYCKFIIFIFFMKVSPLNVVSRYTGTVH